MTGAELAWSLGQSGWLPFALPALGGLMLAAGALGAALAWHPRAARAAVRPPSQPSFRDHVPIVAVEADGRTVVCDGGAAMRVWAVAGADHGGMSRNERLALDAARASLLNGIAQLGVDVRFLSIRGEPRPGEAGAPGDGDGGEPPGAPRALREIRARWSAHIGSQVRINRHWIALSAKDGPKAREALERAGQLIETRLAAYRPVALDSRAHMEALRRREPGPGSPLTPFAALLSPAAAVVSDPAVGPLPAPAPAPAAADGGPGAGSAPKAAGRSTGAQRAKRARRAADADGVSDVRDLLAVDQVSWRGAGDIEFRHGGRTRCMAVVQVRGLPEAIDERVMQDLLRVEASIAVVQVAVPQDKARAKLAIALEAKRAPQMQMGGRLAQKELEESLEELEGVAEGSMGPAELWRWSMSVLCYGEGREGAQAAADEVERALGLAGFQTVRGGFAAEAGYWCAFPGWPQPRPWRTLTPALSKAMLPQTAPSGVEAHDWAPRSLVRMMTSEGSPFGFTFHPDSSPGSAGHMAVIGPTGEGKTTLLSFIAAHVLRLPDSTVWMMDRHRGVEIFCRASGGSYIDVIGAPAGGGGGDGPPGAADGAPGEAAALNPLALPDTPSNRAFLRQWLGGLAGGGLDPEDGEAVARAVALSYERLPPAMRSLKCLQPVMFRPQSKARTMLRRWVDDDQDGALFNSAEDNLEGFRDRLIGWDMTQALEDPDVGAALVSYLMHRVRTRTPGRPTLVCIDETEPMLANEGFRTFLKQGLQEGRKLRHVYTVCFQRPSAIRQAGVSDLLRGQCRTVVFLRNPAGTQEDYEDFGLTEGDLEFILGRSHRNLRWAALCKRIEGPNTAVLDTSLTPLGPWMKVLSSDRRMVERHARLAAEHGPEKGLERFVEGG